MPQFKPGDAVKVQNEDTGTWEDGVIVRLAYSGYWVIHGRQSDWYEVRTADDLPWAHESLIRLASDPVEVPESTEKLGPRDQAHEDWKNHMARQGEREYEEER